MWMQMIVLSPLRGIRSVAGGKHGRLLDLFPIVALRPWRTLWDWTKLTNH